VATHKRPQRDGQAQLVAEWDGLPTTKQPPVPVLTRPDVGYGDITDQDNARSISQTAVGLMYILFIPLLKTYLFWLRCRAVESDFFLIIRPHRSTMYVNAVIVTDGVAWSVGQLIGRSVCYVPEPCKSSWTDWDALGMWTEVGLQIPHGKGQFWRGTGGPL